MVQVVRMPMMGNTMEQGTLVEWAVAEGDAVETDDLVAVVESEKAAQDVLADQEGVLARVDVEEGEDVPPGTVLGIVAGPDESLEGAPAPRSQPEDDAAEAGGDGGADEAAPDDTSTTDRASDDGTADDEPGGASGASTDAERSTTTSAITRRDETDDGESDADGGESGGDATVATPGARKLADEQGVPLADVEGTGPDGAVREADVEALLDAEGDEAEPAESTGRSFAAPSVRRLAREHGVDLGAVRGTGAGGRVTESDVRAAIGAVEQPNAATSGADSASETSATDDETAAVSTGQQTVSQSTGGPTVVEERELSGVRETIADRMTASAQEAPHVTLDRAVDVGRALETAEELSDLSDQPIGFSDLLVAAVGQALSEHRAFNAWFQDGTHRLVAEANVAVAVDADVGLVTPVIEGVGDRSLAGIAEERRSLTDAVLAGTHSMDDLQGGTVTITNLGMFGVDSFTPIINPPQVAILGVGRITDDTCTLSLSFDHRPVDGADAARFLDAIAEGLEAPSALVARQGLDAATAGPSEAPAPTTSDDPEEPTPERSVAGAVDTDADAADPVANAIEADVAAQAASIADHHGWSVPDLSVALADGQPTVTVDRGDGLSEATARRLAYAACRESQYADTVAGLRDPDLEVR